MSHSLACYTPSPSEIAVRALGGVATGVQATVPGRCAYCGWSFQPGDLVDEFVPGRSFMDDIDLAVRDSPFVCGYCATAVREDYLRLTARGLYQASGYQPFNRSEDIAAALLNLPKPPFVITFNTANNQHMIWRSRVTVDRNLVQIRVGLNQYRVRMPMLIAATLAARRLGRSIEQMRLASGKSIPAASARKPGTAPKLPDRLPHPYGFLDGSEGREFKSPATGKLNWTWLRACHEKAAPNERHAIESDIRCLTSISLGELWAMPFTMRTEITDEQLHSKRSTA